MNGKVVQISVSPRGGVPKLRIEKTRLLTNGVEGDKQREKRFHGGPMRAACLFSYERIRELQDEGHPIDCGSTGENLTLEGLDWDTIVPGVRMKIGEALIEITDYTVPCFKIKSFFIDEAFKRMSQKLHPGWSRVYARVLEEGEVREGDPVQVLASDE
jgi:MOSC domain-containing protein YiiM